MKHHGDIHINWAFISAVFAWVIICVSVFVKVMDYIISKPDRKK